MAKTFPFPPPEPEFIEARHYGGSQTPVAVVIHGTVSSDDSGTARNIAKWWASKASPVTSCHYTVDPSEVIQSVGDHRIAYHCGYNKGSIGIELCDEQTGPASRWRDSDSRRILARAARLTAELCLAYSIEIKRPTVNELKKKGPHGIYGHNDSRLAFGYTTHTDPRDFDWTSFINAVRAEARAIREEVVVVDPKANTGTIKDKMKPEAYFIGARGDHVLWMAKRLVEHGLGDFYRNGVDKTFTKGEDMAAVRQFQLNQGWTGSDADGFPGPYTLRLLDADPMPPVTKPPAEPVDPPVVEPEEPVGPVAPVVPPGMGHLMLYAADLGDVPSETLPKSVEGVFELAEARGVAWVVGRHGASDAKAALLRKFGTEYGYSVFVPANVEYPWFAVRADLAGEASISE